MLVDNNHLGMDNIGFMEINELRPFLTALMNSICQLYIPMDGTSSENKSL